MFLKTKNMQKKKKIVGVWCFIYVLHAIFMHRCVFVRSNLQFYDLFMMKYCMKFVLQAVRKTKTSFYADFPYINFLFYVLQTKVYVSDVMAKSYSNFKKYPIEKLDFLNFICIYIQTVST